MLESLEKSWRNLLADNGKRLLNFTQLLLERS